MKRLRVRASTSLIAICLFTPDAIYSYAADQPSPPSKSSRWNVANQLRVVRGKLDTRPQRSSASRPNKSTDGDIGDQASRPSHHQQHQGGLITFLSTFARRLRIPSFQTLRRWQSSEVFANIVVSCQWAILGFLCFEIVKATKQVYREVMDELDGGDSSSPSTLARNAGALLTPTAAGQLGTWLDTPLKEREHLPKSVPVWLARLAHDLKTCSYNVPNQNYFQLFSKLTKQQAVLLDSCLLRPSRETSFATIGGLAHIKKSMKDWISNNCLSPSSSSGTVAKRQNPYERITQQRKHGIVLWGAPGCGKSLLIKAMAREAGWPTLVVTPSLLQSKWYGESTNQVRAFFGLVATLGPSIVVLDELDGLFRSRSKEEHEVSRELKTEWLQWWDGVASSQLTGNPQVLVVGATNRPWDVDPAMWRRLPQRFYVGVPTWDERCDLWRKWEGSFGLPTIPEDAVSFMADSTEGYTPADLFQVLQTACKMGPLLRGRNRRNDYSYTHSLTVEDVQLGLQNVSPTRFAFAYIQQLQSFLTPQNFAQNQQQQAQDPAIQGTYNPTYTDYTNHVAQDTAGAYPEPPNGHVWRTPGGNFYQFHIPVQPHVIEALQNIWLKQQEWEPSSDEEDEDDPFFDGFSDDESDEDL